MESDVRLSHIPKEITIDCSHDTHFKCDANESRYAIYVMEWDDDYDYSEDEYERGSSVLRCPCKCHDIANEDDDDFGTGEKIDMEEQNSIFAQVLDESPVTLIVRKPTFDGGALRNNARQIKNNAPVEKGVLVPITPDQVPNGVSVLITRDFIDFYKDLFDRLEEKPDKQ